MELARRGRAVGMVGALIVAGAVVATLAQLRVHVAEPVTAVATAAAVEAPLVRASSELPPATDASSAPRLGAPEPDEARIEALARTIAEGRGATAAAWGSLRVAAADSASARPLRSVRVRVASGTRLADRTSQSGTSEAVFALTPGAYAVLVLSPGYEPTELPPVAIAAGEAVDLGAVALRRGCARVAGFVRGDAHALRALQVELAGEGRSPCDVLDAKYDAHVAAEAAWTTDTPCAFCGFAAASSRLSIRADGAFAFERLASGPYALRLVDAHGATIGAVERVDVRAGELVRVDLDAPRLRTVDVELVDTDGVSPAREWAERLRPDDEIDFVEERAAIAWDCTFRDGDVELETVGFATPLPRGFGASFAAFGGRKLGTTRKRTVDDRARRLDEPLQPESRIPALPQASIACAVIESGLVRFERVPARAREVVLGSEGFVALARIADAGEHVWAAAELVARTGAPRSELDPAPTTFRARERRRNR